MISIRWADAFEIPDLALIFAQCSDEDPATSEQALRAFMEKPAHTIVAAEADGELAGFICYVIDADKGVVALDWLAVAPRFRRMGVAKALLDFVDRRRRQIIGTALTAQVAEDNLPAQMLLKKSGFTCTRIYECEQDGQVLYHFECGTAGVPF